MEKIYFNYSLKNFPVPSRAPYKLRLSHKIENVIKRMRWKAHFFSNSNERNKEKAKRETFRLKLKHYPCQLRELDNLEKRLLQRSCFSKIQKIKL